MPSNYRNSSESLHNTQCYIIDRQTGDVNGDQVLDTVYLIGDKKDNNYYENLRLVIEDGRTMKQQIIPLDDKYNKAFMPWIFLGNFTDSRVEQIMVNLPVGGSGALTYYYVISLLNNEPKIILHPESFMQFSSNMGLEADYMDDYKVLIQSTKLDQYYILDISDRKSFYEGTVYGIDNKLIKPQKGFFIDLPHLIPARFDGREPYKLQAQNAIAGTSHADRLGYTITYWKYHADTKLWILCPAIFFVLL